MLPLQYNIEGIWYNKKIFAAHGLTAPATWPELVSDVNRQAQGGRGAPALRFRPAGLAARAADQRVPVPVDLGPDALAEGRETGRRN